MLPRPAVLHRRLLSLALILIPLAGSASGAGVSDFVFLQTSDNHLMPRPAGSAPANRGDRAFDGLMWLCEEAAKPQRIDSLKLTTPPPAFVIDTGDLMEYGAIGRTAEGLESAIDTLRIPFFITLGNHDNTWSATLPFIRKRHGSDHYSFDKFGCHFACIDTATPSEPVSSIDRRTLVWLADDLRNVKKDTPVFIFCHHPLSTTEFAQPLEPLRLIQLLEPYNVALLLMGHGHGHRHERWNTLDSIMGGSTSHPADSIGYNIIWTQDGVLRVAFRPRDPAKPTQVTFTKPIAPPPGPRMAFVSPDFGSDDKPALWSRPSMPVEIQIRGGNPTNVVASIDGREAPVPLAPARPGLFKGTLSLPEMVPGMHFVLSTATIGDSKFDRAEEFLFAAPNGPGAGRIVLPAGVKARPLPLEKDLIVATTTGQVQRLTFTRSGRPQSKLLFDAGVEILHAVAADDDALYFSAAEKGVHCLSLAGKPRWVCDVGAAVYGTPALDAQHAYVADMEGNLHAIARATGKLVWSKHHADYSIEMPVLLHDGILYLGSWDGKLYAVRANDGSLVWSKPGPAGHREKPIFKSRYYAPADCPPIAIGDRLFVTDRAYALGSYNLATGEYQGEIAENIASIGLSADGKGFYARGLAKGLTRYDGKGKSAWSVKDLPMGRFPVAPTEAGGRVAVCSNRGMVTVHDAANGNTLLRYQATPRLYVMAPTAITSDGGVCVAGMDGSVTLLSASE